MWSTIFILAGAAFVMAYHRAPNQETIRMLVILFIVNGLFNFIWSVLYFRMQRPDWALIEEPIELARVLRESAHAERCLLVDCLTLWLTNLLMLDDAERLAAEREALLECLVSLPGEIIFVSNETGMGVVPLGELTRRYVDEAGWLHQALAERCQRVVLTVAGLPLTLKGPAL